MALMLSIPVIRAKDEEEIEQALAEEEAKKAEESEEEAEEVEETEEVSEEVTEEAEDVEEEKPVKEFPNKEICGDCNECEFSDDIECEKKNSAKKLKK